jgi:SecD/SecF fusion protein
MKYQLRVLILSAALILLITACNDEKKFNVKMTVVPENAMNSMISELTASSEIIKKRLNTFGIADEAMKIEVVGDRIMLTLSGIDSSSIEVIKGLASIPGNLEFWETFENSEIVQYLMDANKKTYELKLLANYTPAIDTATGGDQFSEQMIDSAKVAEKEKFNRDNPLFAIIYPMVNYNGEPIPSSLVGLVNKKDTSKVRELLRSQELGSLFPRDLKFMWSREAYRYDETKKLMELHAIKLTSIDHKAPLNGKSIISGTAAEDMTWGSTLRLNMNSEGSGIWKRMTAANIDKCIAIVIDNQVISFPRVMAEISGGKTEIYSDLPFPEAQSLAAILSSGSDVLPLKLIVSEVVLEESK